MIPEKRVIRRIQSGGCAIHCQDCSISQLCIPFTLNAHELDQLDNIIERKKPIQKGQTLFKAGDELKSLYAIRSGTIKSYTITEQGDEQITGFHLAGDLVGFDAIGGLKHPSFAQALETSMVCEIPFETLDDLYRFDKLFLGVDGFDLTSGITTPDPGEAQLNRVMCEVAREVIAIADASKFGRTSFCMIREIGQIHRLVTDSRIPAHYLQALHHLGIDVIIADR